MDYSLSINFLKLKKMAKGLNPYSNGLLSEKWKHLNS